MTPRAEIGVLGGSGLYAVEEMQDVEEQRLDTPFGAPSDAYILGSIAGRRVAFLPRHGRGHRIAPGEMNYRANIWGMKMLGVGRILSASAVGSLQESIRPLDIVLPDQFIDRTRARASTFFGDGCVAHVSLADPVCPALRARTAAAAREVGARAHDGGTYLCIEGPQFSTRAESRLYRSWGAAVIGMTNATEARLAREAEICYATIALVTDYDCWHESEEAVSVETIVGYLRRNAETARALIAGTLASLPSTREGCACPDALANAIITDRRAIPSATRSRLGPILDRYLS